MAETFRPITVVNSLTRQKEQLKTVEPGHIRMYACGVTTYDHCHIGHAMQAIYFDVIRNYLEYAGYKVTYVRNYTDVDDKIIERAAQRNLSPANLAQSMIDSTERDMEAIGIRAPDFAPKVSEMIPQIVAMVGTLVKNDAAYATKEGDVYFRVRAKPDYGKLSGRKPDDMRAGTREIVQGSKEDELDFALWKGDQTPGASWPSPWGQGRPGWHIECSAMAKECLGETFDVHGGGRDLIFPHHENEIAQSEAANRKPYATAWLHSGLLTVGKQKMSKSLGNQILISDFLKDWPAEVLRLAYLGQHYSSNSDFTIKVFETCSRRLYYYYTCLLLLDQMSADAKPRDPILAGFEAGPIREEFHRHMAEDFNSAAALGDLNKYFKKAHELAKQKNSPTRAATAKQLAATLRELFAIFGVLLQDPATFAGNLKLQLLKGTTVSEAQIAQMIHERQRARADKNWQRGDEIRDQLAKSGIELMDSPTGTTWGIKYGGE